jgi:hypothetical protein
MSYSRMLHRVALVRTDVLEERIASIIKVKKNWRRASNVFLVVTLIIVAIFSSETLVCTRTTRCNIQEDDILRSHRCENLKSYIVLTGWAL